MASQACANSLSASATARNSGDTHKGDAQAALNMSLPQSNDNFIEAQVISQPCDCICHDPILGNNNQQSSGKEKNKTPSEEPYGFWQYWVKNVACTACSCYKSMVEART
jgi:hypothetical protein